METNNFREVRESREINSSFRVYLLRHGEKPSESLEPELPKGVEEDDNILNPGLQEWHRKRHELGLAPRLRKEDWFDIGKIKIKDNSLSVEGIQQSHELSQKTDIISQVLRDFPKGTIRIKFYSTSAYRTTETGQIIAEEISRSLKKMIQEAKDEGSTEELTNLQRIILEKPGTEGVVNEHLEETPSEAEEKSHTDIDDFIFSIKEEAKLKNENIVVFAITHADKIKNYVEAKTGQKLNRDIEPTEIFTINSN